MKCADLVCHCVQDFSNFIYRGKLPALKVGMGMGGIGFFLWMELFVGTIDFKFVCVDVTY